jgi:hypothetical protein
VTKLGGAQSPIFIELWHPVPQQNNLHSNFLLQHNRKVHPPGTPPGRRIKATIKTAEAYDRKFGWHLFCLG